MHKNKILYANASLLYFMIHFIYYKRIEIKYETSLILDRTLREKYFEEIITNAAKV